ncbi:MAG: pilus assembly protein [Alphaproteobacteria bacterium]|nr:pilus assembly protein [Alphaproteobacteria bacterium]
MTDKRARLAAILRRFLGDEGGAFIVEFGIAFPVLIMLSFGLLEFSLVVFDYQRAAEATRAGVRQTILYTPIANTATILEGSVITCYKTTETVQCDGGSPQADGVADAHFQVLLDEMQGIYPTLEAKNIVITYEGTDVGDAESSGGIFPLVTLQLKGVKHNMIVGHIIGVDTIEFPPFTTTVLGPGQFVNVAPKVGKAK